MIRIAVIPRITVSHLHTPAVGVMRHLMSGRSHLQIPAVREIRMAGMFTTVAILTIFSYHLMSQDLCGTHFTLIAQTSKTCLTIPSVTTVPQPLLLQALLTHSILPAPVTPIPAVTAVIGHTASTTLWSTPQTPMTPMTGVSATSFSRCLYTSVTTVTMTTTFSSSLQTSEFDQYIESTAIFGNLQLYSYCEDLWYLCYDGK